MSPAEVGLHLRKKIYHKRDKKGPPDFSFLSFKPEGRFPVLPNKSAAPSTLLEGVAHEVNDILKGRWLFFCHLPLQVDDPPRWQFDYLVGKDFQTNQNAFQLDNRAKPGGADIKVIWEPSRWYQLVRLAQAAWLLGDKRAGEKCVEWLRNWSATNKPYTGLNWTSGLETGIRLVNYTWIDRMLSEAGTPESTLDTLRKEILPSHQWYTWRYRSFGSSANNHLLGELAGVLLALVRWPQLEKVSAPLNVVHEQFEREVLAQFAPDGGNLEQGLGYHLFSWEFCWQCVVALEAAGRTVNPQVRERLKQAAQFFATMKRPGTSWDFGDSDDAYVTPLFADETKAAEEWRRWFTKPHESPSISFFAGINSEFSLGAKRVEGWQFFPASGFAVFESGDWFLRWDLSPLGYLSMAPHGHLDALHFSLWHKDQPIIIDPGTGCYHAEKEVRNYLADWAAHNSPQLEKPPRIFPERRGAFLWGSHHQPPTFKQVSQHRVSAELKLPYGVLSRSIEFLESPGGFLVEDFFEPLADDKRCIVTLKFAPGITLAQKGSNRMFAQTGVTDLNLSWGEGWEFANAYSVPPEQKGRVASTRAALGNPPLETLASSAFRRLEMSSYLRLRSTNSSGRWQLRISAE